jgi:hypothetical protein
MHKDGVTLIELIVVMTGFSLILLLGMQLFPVSNTLLTRLELTLLSIAIRGARQKALLLDSDQKIIFYPDGSGYYNNYTHHRFATGISLIAPPNALGPPTAPHHAITQPITFPHDTIICYKNGSIQSGSIYLGHKKAHCFYALTSGIAQIPFLRLYKYRLNWISL